MPVERSNFLERKKNTAQLKIGSCPICPTFLWGFREVPKVRKITMSGVSFTPQIRKVTWSGQSSYRNKSNNKMYKVEDKMLHYIQTTTDNNKQQATDNRQQRARHSCRGLPFWDGLMRSLIRNNTIYYA